MCDNRFRIRNKAKRVDFNFTPAFNDVSCNKCKPCRDKLQQEWFVRASYEFKRCRNNGRGFCWFPTLTYNDDNLYYWNDKEYNYTVPAFEKSHFVSFRNKLRVYLKRAGYDFTGDNTIRYFYATEYGGKKGRPHIHCLLFVPNFVPYTLFSKLVDKAWIYGFVRYSPSGKTINSVKAISYTMKYLNKDVAFYREYGIEEYLYLLKKDYIYAIDEQSKEKYLAKYKAFKRHLPHHCQSMGFGSFAKFSDDDFVCNSIPASELGLYDSLWYYQIPMYYKRKYLYDYDKNLKLFTLNDRGFDVKRRFFDKLVDSLAMYLDTKLDLSYYRGMSAFVTDLYLVPSFEDYKNLYKFDSRILAKYLLSFRNVTLSKEDFNYFATKSTDELIDFIDNNALIYYLSRYDVNGIEPKEEYQFSDDRKLYNDLFPLHTMEFGLQFMDSADKLISKYNIDAYYENLYREQIQVKDF